jgi:hypothetical protein
MIIKAKYKNNLTFDENNYDKVINLNHVKCILCVNYYTNHHDNTLLKAVNKDR